MSEHPTRRVLKRDLFGMVCQVSPPSSETGQPCVERDTTAARWWLRWLARHLAAREARALRALPPLAGVPALIAWDGRKLTRSWLDGRPLHHAQPHHDAAYFREALRLLRRLHAAGVVHNDLAKEPNWLVTPQGKPALLDFQLAMRPRMRGRRFRMLAYDDLRHLLKHKRSYVPERLTARERRILLRRSPMATLWAVTGKPLYRFITRRVLGWSDREGADDRRLD